MILEAIRGIKENEDFQIETFESRKCIAIADKILARCQTHIFKRFAIVLFCMLISCLKSKRLSLIKNQELIWIQFHDLRTSLKFRTKWEELFQAFVNEPAFPGFIQYATRRALQNLIKLAYQLDGSMCDTTDHAGQISSLECEALRYVAGYVCRKIREQIKSSSSLKNKDMLLLLLSRLKEDANDNDHDSWIARIDRGGLWHVSEGMFILFYIMEEEVRHYYTIYLPENSDHKKAIILNALLDNDDLLHKWAQITTGEDENVTSDLLKQIIQLHLTIRGFAFARSCLELYKRHL